MSDMKKHFDVPFPLPIRSLKIGIEEDINLLQRNGSASSLTSLTSFDSLHSMDLETSTPSTQRWHQGERTGPREVDDKGKLFCKENAKKRKKKKSQSLEINLVDQDDSTDTNPLSDSFHESDIMDNEDLRQLSSTDNEETITYRESYLRREVSKKRKKRLRSQLDESKNSRDNVNQTKKKNMNPSLQRSHLSHRKNKKLNLQTKGTDLRSEEKQRRVFSCDTGNYSDGGGFAFSDCGEDGGIETDCSGAISDYVSEVESGNEQDSNFVRLEKTQILPSIIEREKYEMMHNSVSECSMSLSGATEGSINLNFISVSSGTTFGKQIGPCSDIARESYRKASSQIPRIDNPQVEKYSDINNKTGVVMCNSIIDYNLKEGNSVKNTPSCAYRNSLQGNNNIPFKDKLPLNLHGPNNATSVYVPSPLPKISTFSSCFQAGASQLQGNINRSDIDFSGGGFHPNNVMKEYCKTSMNDTYYDSLNYEGIHQSITKKGVNKYAYPPLPKCKKSIYPTSNLPFRSHSIPAPLIQKDSVTNIFKFDRPDIRNYAYKGLIGEGSYGLVFKATDRRTKKDVAIKQISIPRTDEGIPCTAIREISLLRSCSHENIVSLMDVIYSDVQFPRSEHNCCRCKEKMMDVDFRENSFTHDELYRENNMETLLANECQYCHGRRNRPDEEKYINTTYLYLTLEYVPLDLKKFMDQIQPVKIDGKLLRYLMYQLFTGMEYCHSKRILHRDLKPQNLLIDPTTMTLKIADFGLSRMCGAKLRTYTNEVVTLWYRCPELLLGINHYSYPVDVWSIAAIFVELSTSKPLFPGDSEIDQIFRIFQKLGTPDEENWVGVTSFKYYLSNFPIWKTQELNTIAPDLDFDGIDLLRGILQYEPDKRLTCTQALQCAYFEDIDNIKNEWKQQ